MQQLIIPAQRAHRASKCPGGSLIRRVPCASPRIENDACTPPDHVHWNINVVQNGFIWHVDEQFSANAIDSTSRAHNRTHRFFFSSRRRHTRSDRDWSSDVCSSD